MAITQLNPYVIMAGTAGEAIALYETALGAKQERIMRWTDLPESLGGAHADPKRIMHAELRIGKDVLMLGDAPPEHPAPAAGSAHVTLHFSEIGEMDAPFAALAAGGQVEMPLHEAFWGARFGMLTDRYGVSWMFHADLKKEEERQ